MDLLETNRLILRKPRMEDASALMQARWIPW
jgi:hypothetical protein